MPRITRLTRSRWVFALTLWLLPLLMRFQPLRQGLGQLAYRIYSVTPLSLARPAARSAARVAQRATDPMNRALLGMTCVRFYFDAGERLENWADETASALQVCDAALKRQAPPEETADLLFAALQLLFHPGVHQGNRPSPFIDDPERTAALLSHPCLRLLRGEISDPGSAPAPQEQRPQGSEASGSPTTLCSKQPVPLNVLVLTDTNFNFMSPIISGWEQDPQVRLRTRDLAQENVDPKWWHPRATILDRLTGHAPIPPAFLADDLAWADVVFVEWAQAFAARLSGAHLSARLIVRLHRYEAFIPTPTLTNWRNVEALITITPYMAPLLARVVPTIDMRTDVRMIPNVTDLTSFVRPKSPAASRTIGVVQYGSKVKDPLWALDVLELLLEQDPDWCLVFVGRPPDLSTTSPAEKPYFEEFNQRVARVGDRVRQLGHRSDLPEVFAEIGVILSSSRVEGAPVSLQEGIASGALPVVRNWPILKAIDGATRLYPSEWIVDTPEEAAERILDWAQRYPEPDFNTESRAWAIAHADAAVTLPQLTHLILQSASGSCA